MHLWSLINLGWLPEETMAPWLSKEPSAKTHWDAQADLCLPRCSYQKSTLLRLMLVCYSSMITVGNSGRYNIHWHDDGSGYQFREATFKVIMSPFEKGSVLTCVIAQWLLWEMCEIQDDATYIDMMKDQDTSSGRQLWKLLCPLLKRGLFWPVF